MTQHRAETLSRLLRCTLDFRVGSIAPNAARVLQQRMSVVSPE